VAETIPIDRISAQSTQTRASLNDTVIDEYAEALEQGIELPPIEVYFDNETYWLADGFHRVKAAQQLGRDSIAANVHTGGQHEAIFHAVGANETHGLRRINAGRRKAVQLMLSDPEWSAWANTEIVRQCHVSEFLVRRVKGETGLTKKERDKETKKKARRGSQEYTINTKRIGTGRKKSTFHRISWWSVSPLIESRLK
jgi:uncharacterized ParB-like nuclease family protein